MSNGNFHQQVFLKKSRAAFTKMLMERCLLYGPFPSVKGLREMGAVGLFSSQVCFVAFGQSPFAVKKYFIPHQCTNLCSQSVIPLLIGVFAGSPLLSP